MIAMEISIYVCHCIKKEAEAFDTGFEKGKSCNENASNTLINYALMNIEKFKWHNIFEDIKDVPNNNKEVLLKLFNSDEEEIWHSVGKYTDRGFVDKCNISFESSDVIAWKEID